MTNRTGTSQVEQKGVGRREFLWRTTAASACALGGAFGLKAASYSAGWRTYEITTRIDVVQPSGATRIWMPLPTKNLPFQKVLSTAIVCDDGATRTFDNNADGLGIVRAEIAAGSKPTLTITNRVATKNIAVDLTKPQSHEPRPEDLAYFLRPTKLIPTGGIVKQKSDEITRGAHTDVDKARRIYEWIVENTYRNPKTRGCGLGNIRFMLESGDLGGKCADLNALYVGLARAAGLPARDLYGIRVGPSELGYHSLGASSENITKAQHCRAEVYIRDFGWTPVDPADVRKVILEEPPGHLPITADVVQKARKRLFGSWEMNWMAYNFAQDVALPGSSGRSVGFLMYPQAETAEGLLDSLSPSDFKYEITSRQIG